jgi:hypothetical protein
VGGLKELAELQLNSKIRIGHQVNSRGSIKGSDACGKPANLLDNITNTQAVSDSTFYRPQSYRSGY